MITTIIIWSIVLLIPYVILYLVRNSDEIDMKFYLFIPGLNHLILTILILFILFQGIIEGILAIIRVYYKKRYKSIKIVTNKISKKIQKEIDPFNEEDWDEDDEHELWREKVNTSKVYNFIKNYKV